VAGNCRGDPCDVAKPNVSDEFVKFSVNKISLLNLCKGPLENPEDPWYRLAVFVHISCKDEHRSATISWVNARFDEDRLNVLTVLPEHRIVGHKSHTTEPDDRLVAPLTHVGRKEPGKEHGGALSEVRVNEIATRSQEPRSVQRRHIERPIFKHPWEYGQVNGSIVWDPDFIVSDRYVGRWSLGSIEANEGLTNPPVNHWDHVGSGDNKLIPETIRSRTRPANEERRPERKNVPLRIAPKHGCHRSLDDLGDDPIRPALRCDLPHETPPPKPASHGRDYGARGRPSRLMAMDQRSRRPVRHGK
jgi:hypothetical protein